MFWFIVVNWIGCACLYAGYILLTLPKEFKKLGIAVTVLGQILVGVWAYKAGAWPIFYMEILFFFTSLFQMMRLKKVI